MLGTIAATVFPQASSIGNGAEQETTRKAGWGQTLGTQNQIKKCTLYPGCRSRGSKQAVRKMTIQQMDRKGRKRDEGSQLRDCRGRRQWVPEAAWARVNRGRRHLHGKQSGLAKWTQNIKAKRNLKPGPEQWHHCTRTDSEEVWVISWLKWEEKALGLTIESQLRKTVL